MEYSDRFFDRYIMVVHMSEFIWCHGPSCHTHATQDRVRGSKGSKVLRTRKVKQHRGYQLGTSFYNWFCSQGCYNEFANKYVEQIIRIAPKAVILCKVRHFSLSLPLGLTFPVYHFRYPHVTRNGSQNGPKALRFH